ncbi:MAG: cupin domain-containing protein [Sulfobacillus sp.]
MARLGFLVQVAGEDALQPLVAGQSHFSAVMAWLIATVPLPSLYVVCSASLVERVRSACPSLDTTHVVGLSDQMALGVLTTGISVREWDSPSLGDRILPGSPLAESTAAPFRVVDKPWGREIWWAETDRYLGKLIEVRAGHALSLQYHRQKLETLWVVSGRGRFQIGDNEVLVGPGYSVTVEPGIVHRISADDDLRVIEVSSPQADDVVRLADRYGRQ